MKNLTGVFLIFFWTLSAQHPNETRWWFFGYKAGLHFQTNTVSALPGLSKMLALEATSVRADSAGSLLFYTWGGEKVYNRLHDTMHNGNNIQGHPVGQQACLIIRKTGSKYYIFQNNFSNFFQPGISPMLSYSIVDMSLAAGMGSVTIKNQSITPAGLPIVEKMAATRHCNLQDHWLLVHRGGFPAGSNEFMAYLVTANGVSKTPVVSAVGTNQIQFNPGALRFFSTMKFSPNGRKVCSMYNYRTVELYDFDNATGQLSNPMKIDSTVVNTASSQPFPYGTEFSPDGTKLYVTYAVSNSHPFLCQYDLTQNTVAGIAASKTIIDSLPPGGSLGMQLQLAVDGRIYVASVFPTRNNYLGIIKNPNVQGIMCNFDSLGINLGIIPNSTLQATSNRGLPQFVSNYFEQKPTIQSFTGGCGTASFVFPTVTAFPATGYSVQSFSWNFGDPLSGSIANTSTLANPSHTFSSNGSFTVKLLLHYKCGVDTIKQKIDVTGLPALSVTGSTAICRGEALTWTFSGASSYTFNGNATSQPSVILQPSVTTNYTLTGFDSSTACTATKQLTLSVLNCNEIGDIGFNNDIQIYPNPHDGQINIIVTEYSDVEIFNTMGYSIYKNSFQPGRHKIDLPISPEVLFVNIVNSKAVRYFKVFGM